MATQLLMVCLQVIIEARPAASTVPVIRKQAISWRLDRGLRWDAGLIKARSQGSGKEGYHRGLYSVKVKIVSSNWICMSAYLRLIICISLFAWAWMLAMMDILH